MAQTEPQSLATTALSILNEQTPQEQLYPHLLSDLRNETAMDKIRGFLEIFPFEQLSFARIELFSKLISMIALLLMLRRTYVYVAQRRRGTVGPTMATRFVKFWTAVGILQFASQGLMLYATPFHGTWLVSLLKMIALILLSFGQRLGVAEDIYNGKVVPLYDAYAPEIETQFGRAREHWGKVNDAFKELATLLLKRIAVGGLSGAVSLPNAAGVEAGSQQSQHGQEGDRIAPALPPETATFSTGRHFFAGKADERAETVSGSNASNMRGAIQATIVEAPKPAYEESRALRERFRRQIKERRGGKLVE